MFLVLLVVFLALILLLIGWYFRLRTGSALSKIPGPVPLPFIGNFLHLFVFYANSLLMLRDLHKKYGDVFKLNMAGVDFVFLARPESVAQVLQHSTTRYLLIGGEKSRKFGISTDILFDMHGRDWKVKRHYVQKAFDQKHVRSIVKKTAEKARVFADRLEELYQDSKQFDMYAELRRFMFDVMGTTILGAEFGMMTNDEESIKLPEALEYLLYQLTVEMFLPKIFHRNSKQLKESAALVKQLLENKIAEYQKYSDEDLINSGNILSLLVLAGRHDDKIQLSHDQVRDEAWQFVAAGYDTSKSTLGIIFHDLGTHPKEQSILREELNQLLGNREITSIEDVAISPYLFAFMKESQRLTPVVPSVDRILEEDVQIDGHLLPKGTVVATVSPITHTDARYWGSDGMEFKPERFLKDDDETSSGRHRMAFIPFGGGPKMCVGFQLAQMQVRVALATLVRRFEFSIVPGNEKMQLYDSIVLVPSNVHLTLKPIKQKTN